MNSFEFDGALDALGADVFAGGLMKIRKSSEFLVIKVESKAVTPPQLTIKNSKLKSCIEVAGGVLEAQYTVNDSYLLFATEGTPFEEALHIHLLDEVLRLKDQPFQGSALFFPFCNQPRG